MRAQLTNRDYEQLSAYIDGQLSPVERTKLEERLRVHADLQVALDELSRTKALLRSAPRRRAPRNFTLSPAMVGQQTRQQRAPWWNLFPVLGFTSALATLVLVATIVFQLLPGQSKMQTTAMQPEADQVANIVEQTMTAMQITMPAAQAPQPAAGAPSPEQGGIGNAREARTATPRIELFVAPEATATEAAEMAAPVMQPTPTPDSALPAAEATAALDQAVPQDTPQPTPQPTTPVVAWGNDTVNPGMGGMGGGGGQQGTAGSLLSPPAVADAGEGMMMGKGGGAGTEGVAVPGENIVIPQESVNSETEDATAQSQPEKVPNEPVPAPAQPNAQITGTGPILGVPSAEEGGQIVERKAILGQPGARQSDSPEKPRSGVDVDQPADQSDRSAQPAGSQTLFGLPVLLVLQFLLGLIAIAAGVAAFIVRKRAR